MKASVPLEWNSFYSQQGGQTLLSPLAGREEKNGRRVYCNLLYESLLVQALLATYQYCQSSILLVQLFRRSLLLKKHQNILVGMEN